MKNRSSILVGCGLAALFGLTVLVCVGVVGAFLVYDGDQVVQIRQLTTDDTSSVVNRIVYVGTDGNIYTAGPQGEGRIAITDDAGRSEERTRTYSFPTWAPDSQHIALVGVVSEEDGSTEATLYVASPDGRSLSTLHQSEAGLPFYLYWSPDSQRIAYLTQEQDGLSLRLATLAEKETRRLETGSPNYYSWAPDSERLVLHIGGSRDQSPNARLSLLHLDGGGSRPINASPATFRAPAWSPEGDWMLYAASDQDGQSHLYVADETGERQSELVDYQDFIAFEWSPQGDRIAYLTSSDTNPLQNQNLGRLQIIRPDGTDRRTISEQRVWAFFWAPDGEKIAYITRANSGTPEPEGRSSSALLQQGPLQFHLQIASVDGGEPVHVATFRPTRDFLSLVPFFDQYAQSMTLWSPEGDALTYAVQENDGGSGIWIAHVEHGHSAHRIADGSVAYWSWR